MQTQRQPVRKNIFNFVRGDPSKIYNDWYDKIVKKIRRSSIIQVYEAEAEESLGVNYNIYFPDGLAGLTQKGQEKVYLPFSVVQRLGNLFNIPILPDFKEQISLTNSERRYWLKYFRDRRTPIARTRNGKILSSKNPGLRISLEGTIAMSIVSSFNDYLDEKSEEARNQQRI